MGKKKLTGNQRAKVKSTKVNNENIFPETNMDSIDTSTRYRMKETIMEKAPSPLLNTSNYNFEGIDDAGNRSQTHTMQKDLSSSRLATSVNEMMTNIIQRNEVVNNLDESSRFIADALRSPAKNVVIDNYDSVVETLKDPALVSTSTKVFESPVIIPDVAPDSNKININSNNEEEISNTSPPLRFSMLDTTNNECELLVRSSRESSSLSRRRLNGKEAPNAPEVTVCCAIC